MKTKAIIIKTFVTAIAKGGSAFLAFFATLAITRNLDIEQAGYYFLIISILAVLGVLFRLGLDNVVLKSISSVEGRGDSPHLMTHGLGWSFLVSIIFSLGVFVLSEDISEEIFSKPEFTPILALGILLLPFRVVSLLLASGFQAYHRVVIATLCQNLGITILFLIGFYFLLFLDQEEISAYSAVRVYATSGLVIFLLALLVWHRQIKGNWGRLWVSGGLFWKSSFNMWLSTSMAIVVQWSGVLIAAAYVSATEIAYLSAAQRTANLIGFILVIANMVLAPKFAQLWYEEKYEELESLAKWSARAMLLIVIPLMIFIIVYREAVMNVFGEGFESSAILLLIIAIGQCINVLTGSVGYLLNMSGHERDFRRVTFIAGPITIVLSFILLEYYGVVGGAIATAVGLSLQNIGALFYVRKRLGFWPVGM